MNTNESPRVTRRHFLASASFAVAAFSIAPDRLSADQRDPVTASREAAAAADIKVQKMRGDVSVLIGSGGNIAVLAGADGKVLVDAGMVQSSSRPISIPAALMQPIASEDVAAALADVAVGEPINGTVEIAGPEQIRQDELVRQFLSATGDARKVITDVHARYYGLEVNDQSLVPGRNPRLGPTRFAEWLSRSIARGELRKAA